MNAQTAPTAKHTIVRMGRLSHEAVPPRRDPAAYVRHVQGEVLTEEGTYVPSGDGSIGFVKDGAWKFYREPGGFTGDDADGLLLREGS